MSIMPIKSFCSISLHLIHSFLTDLFFKALQKSGVLGSKKKDDESEKEIKMWAFLFKVSIKNKDIDGY